MDVRFSPEAETQIAIRRAWWREHRDEAEIFDEELAHAVARIGDSPSAFPWFGIRGGRSGGRPLPPGDKNHHTRSASLRPTTDPPPGKVGKGRTESGRPERAAAISRGGFPS